MKTLGWIMILLGLLTGCGAAETFETVADEIVIPAMAEPREIWVALPEDSVLPAMESDSGQIYLCEDYDVAVLTMEAGNLEATVREVSGYDIDDLTILKTADGEVDQYEFVWTSAGELGQEIGRATILDDGAYHYVLYATMDAEKVTEYQEVWNGIFESFSLVSY